ncbi:hypothetical protein PHYBLDRAFT_157966 [Phycomyces blakesleeanus NRRL 1555(-)]|uniref:RecQ mediated genome instability protein 1 N-terminal domain-containing protein n=2 Tax=Phycomyces blakesleeanus TaxID=4837 RepID=A0A163AYS3_PHYB8|nr:hypothetical protein PHYBLDRAFT_157966 [Phycomyces blakesleeanus NRRL 1555(-)]OAD76631.1 hypothetical protein PHYBLDRAFT_157966 [Phycomyces blakesleeanus NRRL 1555(-)]|eukprot:XP_018294671.1 hypothetical protein PHYBLDRAFT_157966 [Phycomyces blakesleeanus NRRL 1555(-)]
MAQERTEDDSIPDDMSRWMEDNLVVLDDDDEIQIKQEKDSQKDEPINTCASLRRLLLRIKSSINCTHPDQVLLKCKGSKLGKLRVHPASGYYLVVHLVDPDTDNPNEDVAVVFGDKFISELSGKPYSEVHALDKHDKSKSELKKAIGKCHSKLLKTIAFVKLDLTMMETAEDGTPMPNVIEYTPC